MPNAGQKFASLPGARAVRRRLLRCAIVVSVFALPAAAQVLTIDTKGNAVQQGQGSAVDRRFAQVEPTHVQLPTTPMGERARLELMRFLQAEQGFAMRPLPRGHKGLTLLANGKLEPAGEPYLAMVTAQGLSAKPGDRVVITDVKVEHEKIILMLNGGPDAKHRFLRHIQVGGGMGTSPIVQDDGEGPVGSRVTLTFKDRVPEVTGKQVEDLLAPLISFQVKTPIQAFTDTLPPALKSAILDHHVLVGMSTDMVLFAKGQPARKVREMDGQNPFEEWIYGKPPEDVEFVRINGNRVIRVEVAKMGKPPVIFEKDEVEGLMRTDGTPIIQNHTTRTVDMGDVTPDLDKQAPAAPPSLRQPGEAIPNQAPADSRLGTMKPVQFPKQAPDDHPVAHRNKPAESDTDQAAPDTGPATPQPTPDASQPAPSQPSSQPQQ
ncbi:MAG TPA: hypothetical protein VN151_12270 [Terracidiphilus sp.]|nr:hypothetical protein [Terracidiphilus sp.]